MSSLQADVLRLLILRRYGGIYLDNDIYVVNSLDKYRR
jgi:mannosyltransferase OCH1-like enzyme